MSKEYAAGGQGRQRGQKSQQQPKEPTYRNPTPGTQRRGDKDKNS